jgi:hypothetical protein
VTTVPAEATIDRPVADWGLARGTGSLLLVTLDGQLVADGRPLSSGTAYAVAAW